MYFKWSKCTAEIPGFFKNPYHSDFFYFTDLLDHERFKGCCCFYTINTNNHLNLFSYKNEWHNILISNNMLSFRHIDVYTILIFGSHYKEIIVLTCFKNCEELRNVKATFI